MLTTMPVGLDQTVAASLPAYLMRKMKAPSGEAAAPAPDREKSEDLDGCEVEIAEATSDEDLPASEGGVA
jgi:hypothetical protein